jgi:hypothetical protein
MSLPRLSWNMDEQGVACISATDAEGRMFPVCDLWRKPAIDRGGMTKEGAQAFQVFAAERICAAWNRDEDAAKIAEGHIIDPALGLTEWGQGHNAACQQIAHEIRRRFKF